jgi:hypothetical protein
MPITIVSCTTAGAGAGTVGNACGTFISSGMTANLLATPNPGSTFAGWSGDPICANSFTMPSVSVNCTATFTLNPPVSASLESNLALALTVLGITAIAGFKKWRNKKA